MRERLEFKNHGVLKKLHLQKFKSLKKVVVGHFTQEVEVMIHRTSVPAILVAETRTISPTLHQPVVAAAAAPSQ